jgi:hypothetical protein
LVQILEERRSYPRIKTNLKVDVSENILGDSIDLSEGGLSFSCTQTIRSPEISLQVCFPGSEFKLKANAMLVWNRNLESGVTSYGVEFVDLDDNQKSILRKELIKAQISGLLDEVKIPEVKKLISDFFLKDMLSYINELIKIGLYVSKENKYSEGLERKLDQLHTQALLKGYCLEELLTHKRIIQKVKDNFRLLVGTWIYKSSIVKCGFEKPQGYAGDYKISEIIYDNKPISKGIGTYLDNYFLKSPYAVTVRMRKNRLREILKNYINGTKSDKVNVLNIACGSCREIRELLPDLKTKSTISFTCLDWDKDALKFSQDTLLPLKPGNVEFKFYKENVMNLIKDGYASRSLSKQNLIYSIGFIDYLPDRILKRLIYALYQLLQKEGKFILTHKNREKTFPPIPPDWFCDWNFVPRNKEELTKLFYDCGISKFLLSLESDDFNYMFYFTLTKL